MDSNINVSHYAFTNNTMSKPDPSNPLASFYLKTIVKDLLHGEHYTPISDETAEVILHHCKNRNLCHVQFPSDEDVDIIGVPISTPVLWEIGAWCRSSEKWLKVRNRSQKDREERFVLDANINMVSRKILKFAYVNPDAARIIARQWINNKQRGKLKMVGVEKLYTTVEELP